MNVLPNRWASLAPVLLLLAVLLTTAAVYRPGLSGPFLFDDYANLPALGATGPIDNADALWRYLTSSTADPTGRPLTVASFLLDAQDWPALPRPFKVTNVCLHLLNGVLLAWLLLALGRELKLGEAHAQRAAVLGAALWLLHPLFVSTTLYIVQREAMLPMAFIISGLLLWLKGRRHLVEGRHRSGVLLEVAGLGAGTLLATLCKANGALLPAYALLVEYLLLRRANPTPPPRHRLLTLFMGWLPALMLAGYLLHTAFTLLGHGPPFGRDWTEGQRLLTEPRVLWDYLRLLWLPRPFTPGLFNDQIQASTGWLTPATTLLSIIGLTMLIGVAVVFRRRAPAWTFAIAFFLVGHAVESTTIPLELYFEHRNYIPALPMFWPLALWLTAPGARAAIRGIAALALMAGLAALTASRAQLWGNATEQGLMWARLNPDSPRAQSYAAQIMMAQGAVKPARDRLRALLPSAPDQIQIAFNLIGADCRMGGVPSTDIEATRHALLITRRLGELSFQWLGHALDQAHRGVCPGLDMNAVTSFIEAAWRNPATKTAPGWQQDLLNLKGRRAIVLGQPEAAYQYFLAALRARPRPSPALEQAAMLGSAGQQRLALCELSAYDAMKQPASATFSMAGLHRWVLERQHYWPREFAHLRAALQADLPPAQAAQACPQEVDLQSAPQ